MSNLLKDIYTESFYSRFSQIVGEVVPSFNQEKFIELIFEGNWKEKELKERMKHTSLVLKDFLPQDFAQSAEVIEEIINRLRQNNISEKTIEFMFLPDFIERFGINHFEIAVKTIEFVTQFTSCEFAVRPFILRYGDRMLKEMLRWSTHENHRVRRLASEGSRPRLPWAVALPELKKNPNPILPILENLKTDSSEYVRRSVANSLNDISKDNPDILMKVAKQWKGISKETDGIIKHASRTLLKQGFPDILEYFGLHNSDEIVLSDFQILIPKLKVGENLMFSFELQNASSKAKLVRLEYGIYFLRQNGTHSRKVFKISERQFQPNEKVEIQRKQSFKPITTRKYYAGQNKLSIIINGQERILADFEITLKDD